MLQYQKYMTTTKVNKMNKHKTALYKMIKDDCLKTTIKHATY